MIQAFSALLVDVQARSSADDSLQRHDFLAVRRILYILRSRTIIEI
jgi:hypothetical protein